MSLNTRTPSTVTVESPPPSRRAPPDVPTIDLERTYRELAPRVLGYLHGAGVPDPENALGEVFLSVVRGVDGFAGDEDALRRWVFSIAHNRMIDAHRQRRRRPLVVARDVLDQPVVDPGLPDPELVDALGRLGPEQRAVVLLRFVSDLPTADVAVILDRSPAAVKKLQQRALANLRRSLDNKARPPDGDRTEDVQPNTTGRAGGARKIIPVM